MSFTSLTKAIAIFSTVAVLMAASTQAQAATTAGQAVLKELRMQLRGQHPGARLTVTNIHDRFLSLQERSISGEAFWTTGNARRGQKHWILFFGKASKGGLHVRDVSWKPGRM